MVGWDKSNDPEMSHTQASPPAWLATRLSNRNRTGSPIALNMRANSTVASTLRGSCTNGVQHASSATSGSRS